VNLGDVFEAILVATMLLAVGVAFYFARVRPMMKRWDKFTSKKPFEFRGD
jgi:hypothetical protein